MREIIWNGPKRLCACGCGKLIPLRSVCGKEIFFAHGHRRLTSEESEERRKIFERISGDPGWQLRRLQGMHMKPTDLEQRLILIIEKYELPFKYVGNGSFVIGRCNPDFIAKDGSKRAIDIFGNYWHKLPGRTPASYEDGRKALFASYGYCLLVLWQSELMGITDYEIYLKIKNWLAQIDRCG
jgi:hypothetical protein